MPKVSVIVTTYNRKDYLTETIWSILNQSYQDFELIVVDNFSNYDFLALIDSFKNDKIIPLQNHNNGIIAINRNFGIKHAKGEFIAFCDDDDIWVTNKLEDQMNFLIKNNCHLVYANMNLFQGDITNIIKKTSSHKINHLKKLVKLNPVYTSSVLVRNKDLFFPEDPYLVGVEDYALWLDLYIKGYRFDFLNTPLVYFRLSQNNTSKKTWDTRHLNIIYLHTSILLRFPELNIKMVVIREIIMNFLKFMIKHRFSKKDIG